MRAKDSLEIFTTLLLVIVADAGVTVYKCRQPLKCISFAECSTGDRNDSAIIFNCDGSRHNGDLVCCLPSPQSTHLYNSSARPQWTSEEDVPSGSSTRMPISNRDPRPPGLVNQPVTSASELLSHPRNESADSNNKLFTFSRGDCEDSSSTPSSPASSPGPEATNEYGSSTSDAASGRDDHAVDQKMSLLPQDECGVSTASRIINGQNASFGQFPWMALLGYRLRDGTLSFLCGGTLINKQYILTAAHCLEPEGAVLEEVRLGEHNLDTEPDCEVIENIENYCTDPVLDIPIESTDSHEKFNSPYLKNDIALVRLRTPVNETTDYIRPICLPFGLNITGQEVKTFEVAGWGKTNNHRSDGSAVLQFTGTLSMPLEDCDPMQDKEVRPLDHTQFCAGAYKGKDACKGDSGGPLMDTLPDPSEATLRTFQIGIVSFGSDPCGVDYAPSVYTRVTAYLDWILDHIQP